MWRSFEGSVVFITNILVVKKGPVIMYGGRYLCGFLL